jgi:hypothetical protein
MIIIHKHKGDCLIKTNLNLLEKKINFKILSNLKLETFESVLDRLPLSFHCMEMHIFQ